jgi:hypothetical protein
MPAANVKKVSHIKGPLLCITSLQGFVSKQ